MRLSGREAGVCGRVSGWGIRLNVCWGREGGGSHTGYVYMVEKCTNNNGQTTQKLQKRYISTQSNTITKIMMCMVLQKAVCSMVPCVA